MTAMHLAKCIAREGMAMLKLLNRDARKARVCARSIRRQLEAAMKAAAQ